MSFPIEQNEDFSLAYRYVTETAENVFLTGKAGTGKTTFLKHLVANCPKTVVVAAPTGVAAINAGGVTLHSLFQLPFSPFLPTRAGKEELLKKVHFAKQRLQVLRALELLVIDEVSMVRADVMDAIDTLLRSVRRNHAVPFGGVQLLFIGDLFQLPPVVPNAEWPLLREYYSSAFFFDSLVIREQMPLLIELRKIYRQKETSFVELLNRVRTNSMAPEDFEALESRFKPGYVPYADEKYITLTSHNKQAELINAAALQRLPGEALLYNAVIEDDFGEHLFPADAELKLKIGAQVMFLKNDPNRQYFNGKIGIIHKLEKEMITVDCDGEKITVGPHEWQNTRYSAAGSDGVLRQEVLGTFSQFPLRAAWAITIHKSQGLTFEKMMLDAAAAFAAGQVYVALSRCTSLEGIVLLSRIPAAAVLSDGEVVKAQTQLARGGEPEKLFPAARMMFTMQILEDLFLFKSALTAATELSARAKVQADKLNAGAADAAAEELQLVRTMAQQGEKFLMQANSLLKDNPVVEENMLLQERLKAATNYFSEKTIDLLAVHSKHAYSSEHREPAEIMSAALNSFADELKKLRHLFSFRDAPFSLPGFLQHKAAFREPRSKRNIYGSPTSEKQEQGGMAGLYLSLKHWRDGVCKDTGLPIFRVANQKTIEALTQILPQTKEELLTVTGFGKTKVRDWGAEVIDIIKEWCEENGVERGELHVPVKKENARAPRDSKTPSADVSFALLQQGKSIEEVAAERNLARTTIEGHLTAFAATGQLNVAELVGEKHYRQIAEQISRTGEAKLNELKSALPAEIGFGEIRLVMAAEQFLQSKQPA